MRAVDQDEHRQQLVSGRESYDEPVSQESNGKPDSSTLKTAPKTSSASAGPAWSPKTGAVTCLITRSRAD
jgi:hypothetical protein